MANEMYRRRMSRTGAVVVGVMIAAASLSGCAPASGGADDEFSIVFVPGLVEHTFYNTLAQGVEEKAAELGMSYSMQGAPEWSAPAQTSVLDAVCSKAPDAVIISPTDAVAMRAPIERCMDGGTLVVTVDTHLDDTDGLLSAITSDDVKGGELAAQYIGERLNGEGVVSMTTTPNVVTLQTRTASARAYFEKNYPGITLLADQSVTITDEANAASVTAATIVGNPEVDAFFDPSGVFSGVIQSIKAADDGRERFFVGYNSPPAAVTALKACEIAALVTQTPAEEGKLAAQFVFDALSGNPDAVKANALVEPQIIPCDKANDPDVQGLFDLP